LLGDRTAALANASGGRIAPRGPKRAPQVDAVVIEEASILDRDNGIPHIRRNLLGRQLLALQDAAGSEQRTVCRFERRRSLAIGIDAAADRQCSEKIKGNGQWHRQRGKRQR
jgi:hypothetical protein